MKRKMYYDIDYGWMPTEDEFNKATYPFMNPKNLNLKNKIKRLVYIIKNKLDI